MAWILTKEHDEEQTYDVNIESKGKFKPTDKKIPFRLYSDDGDLTYSGLISETRAKGPNALAPLDWASESEGCTRMDIKEKGKWSTLGWA